MKPENIIKHFCTITKHKKAVMSYCFRAGMYRQGLMHDMSKYSPVEFIPGCIYYQGVRSPNNEERERTGVSRAWLHHKGRNKHHFEYWIDYSNDPDLHGVLVGNYMPVRYVVEMFFDRLAACRVYQHDSYQDDSALKYYMRGRAKRMINPRSKELLEKLLRMNAEQGEEATIQYIRTKLLPNARRLDRKYRAEFTAPRK